MKILMRISMAVIAVSLIFVLSACEKEGPFEEAGEKIDQTVEETKEKIEDSVNPAGPAEKVGEKIDGIVEETKEEARQLKENVEDSMKE